MELGSILLPKAANSRIVRDIFPRSFSQRVDYICLLLACFSRRPIGKGDRKQRLRRDGFPYNVQGTSRTAR